MMRAALYARVSTDRQVEKYGIPSQIEGLKKRCLEKGWGFVADGDKRVFIDDGYSGSELARPALIRLRKAAEEGLVDIVLAYDPDRLSRNLSDLLLLESEFTRYGAKLDFVTQEVDTSPEGKMFFAIRGAVAQYEREKIRERSIRGAREKVRQGKVLNPSCAPLGYSYDKGNATLVEDPEKAKTVRLIFHLFVNENMSLLALASRLNELRIPTCRAGSKWRPSTVHKMLRNETYAGRLHQFRYHRTQPKVRTSISLGIKNTSSTIRPREEWMTVAVSPIILDSLFQAAQRKLDRNSELARRNTKREYLLSGLLNCSFCKGRMIGHNIRGVSFYRCARRHNPDRIPFGPDGNPKPCECPDVRSDVVESKVWKTVCQLVKEPDFLIQELRNRCSESSETRESILKELELCQNRLKAIPQEQKRLVEGYRKGMYPDFMMKEEMERVAKEKAELEAREAELRRQLEKSVITGQQEDQIKNLVRRVSSSLDMLDFAGRQELLRLLVEKVFYDGQKLEIHTIISLNEQLHPLAQGGYRGMVERASQTTLRRPRL